MTVLTHRIRLDLNNVQRTWMERCAGTARFTYNWGLARWNKLYKAREKPNWRKLNAELNAKKSGDFAWMRELPWRIMNGALADLGNAFTHFFRRMKTNDKPGYPRFKKRGRCREGFTIEGRALVFDGCLLKIPKIGWVHTRTPLRFPGKVLGTRFTKRAGHWYVSVQVEIDESRWSYPHRCETQAVVGVDLGVRDLAVLSTGERIETPRAMRAHERRLRRLNKELARRTKGKKNWRKTKAKLAKLHERITNIRRDVVHKLTTCLVRDFRRIGIEDLCIKGMVRTRLAKSVMDAAMGEVGRQLAYKAPLAGGVIVKADRWFPSSKTCSDCGVIIKKLPLSVREWACRSCGATLDRDVNAAINLKNLAASQAVTAQRQGGSDLTPRSEVKLPFGWESSSVVDLG